VPERFALIASLALAVIGCSKDTRPPPDDHGRAPAIAPTTTAPPPTSYVTCGCGCCGGPGVHDATDPKVCLYHAKGDRIEDVIARDLSARRSRDCEVAGCAKGTLYEYCD
jgi:hypothetical protein